MIVLTCPNCESTKVEKYEKVIAETGHDWFKCKECNNDFPLKHTSYRQELDLFE